MFQEFQSQTVYLARSKISQINELPAPMMTSFDPIDSYHDLGSVGRVDADAHNEQVHDVGWDLLLLRNPPVVFLCHIHLHHCHPVHSQRACLVGADGSGIAHGLTGVKVPDQVVILHHFLENTHTYKLHLAHYLVRENTNFF